MIPMFSVIEITSPNFLFLVPAVDQFPEDLSEWKREGI